MLAYTRACIHTHAHARAHTRNACTQQHMDVGRRRGGCGPGHGLGLLSAVAAAAVGDGLRRGRVSGQ